VKFIDEAIITVRSGDGGNGCLSFRREKSIPRGGPDGGNGGKGGHIILKSTPRRRTLQHFRFKSQFKAPNGAHGHAKQKTGKNGADLLIQIPPGTVACDYGSGEILKDFVEPNAAFIVAKGGRGGRGNVHFKSSTHRTPRFAQKGEQGQTRKLKLELKLLADVGIIGLPNAGKSTLISRLSSARPKIGDYPFTTLTPTLGVVPTPDGEPFVVADIPGLIEGAHSGAGMGTRFLRHIERTRILIHLIDATAVDPDFPLKGYEAITRELALYDNTLIRKPQILVLNKMDLPGTAALADRFMNAAKKKEVLRISAFTGQGLDLLKSQLIHFLDICLGKRSHRNF